MPDRRYTVRLEQHIVQERYVEIVAGSAADANRIALVRFVDRGLTPDEEWQFVNVEKTPYVADGAEVYDVFDLDGNLVEETK